MHNVQHLNNVFHRSTDILYVCAHRSQFYLYAGIIKTINIYNNKALVSIQKTNQTNDSVENYTRHVEATNKKPEANILAFITAKYVQNVYETYDTLI